MKVKIYEYSEPDDRYSNQPVPNNHLKGMNQARFFSKK